MSPLFRILALSPLLAGQAVALFSQGTISDRDYQLTYTDYNDTTAFCTAFRAECVDYVGALNYHHNLDCVVSQAGPTIYAWCGGVEKDTSGDTGSGPAVDFTHLVCPETQGCSVKKEPEEPVEKYAGGSSATSSASSTPSSTTVTVASSATSSSADKSSADKSKMTASITTTEEEEVLDTPPTDSSLLTSIPSTATWATFASQASLAAAPTLEHLSAPASVKTGALNAAATGSGGADAESGAVVGAGRGGAVVMGAVVGTAVGVFFL